MFASLARFDVALFGPRPERGSQKPAQANAMGTWMGTRPDFGVEIKRESMPQRGQDMKAQGIALGKWMGTRPWEHLATLPRRARALKGRDDLLCRTS